MESYPAAPITGLRASLVPMGPLFTPRWQVVKQNAASYKVDFSKNSAGNWVCRHWTWRTLTWYLKTDQHDPCLFCDGQSCKKLWHKMSNRKLKRIFEDMFHHKITTNPLKSYCCHKFDHWVYLRAGADAALRIPGSYIFFGEPPCALCSLVLVLSSVPPALVPVQQPDTPTSW